MKVLLVNKFLYPKGGSETYVFKLGESLENHGHQVEYFGLENEKNIVGNSANALVTDMDFNKGVWKNLTAPFRMLYSFEAKRKMKKVLETFQPDVVHFNNIQFHLTPSMIVAVERYRKKTGRKVKIVYTAHDYQLVCPSHGLFDVNIQPCEKCLAKGKYTYCFKTKCMKNSRAKSFLAMMDAYLWKWKKTYQSIDVIVCPSKFMKSKLDTQPRFASKTVALHNFFDIPQVTPAVKEGYVLEFGHLSKDKGTLTLLEVAKRMPETRFLFAGYGSAEEEIKKVENAQYVGFKTGDELHSLIQKAACSVCPTECYENCPYTVIESQTFLTPVIGSRMGGIPELIQEGKTGLLFDAGNANQLEEALRFLLERAEEFSENCKQCTFETPETYYEKLLKIYGDESYENL